MCERCEGVVKPSFREYWKGYNIGFPNCGMCRTHLDGNVRIAVLYLRKRENL